MSYARIGPTLNDSSYVYRISDDSVAVGSLSYFCRCLHFHNLIKHYLLFTDFSLSVFLGADNQDHHPNHCRHRESHHTYNHKRGKEVTSFIERIMHVEMARIR